MKTKLLPLLLFLFFLSPGSLLAQGLFQGFGFPVPVVSSGQTEVVGLILASMRFGPVTADTLVVDVSPLQITNANPADIVVTASGLTVDPTIIDTTNNWIEIPVEAGSASSGVIRIEGIRVAVAGANINSFNARLFWLNSRNAFTAGASVPVISAVQTGIVAQSMSSPSVFSGQVYNSSSTIQLSEEFPGAFSNSSQYGQTGPTQIQITVSNFPAGTQMNFPAAVAANESAATLATTNGQAAVLTGNGTVTYAYSSAANSGEVAESFNMTVLFSFSAPLLSLQPKIQVTLAPIGAAVPNASSSTSIPRYAENEITVQPAASLTVSKILYWTGINAALQNRVEITNPSSQPSNLTIDAFDSNGKSISGSGVTNPVKLRLPGNQSLTNAVADLFGSTAGISTIRIQSTTADLIAGATITGNGVNAAVPFVSAPVTSLILPVVNNAAKLQVMNPSTDTITGTLTLLGLTGQVVSTAFVKLAGLASTVLTLETVFGTTPQSGYASVIFSSPVVAYESFRQNNQQMIQPPSSGPSVFVPFIAGGSSFRTNVNLINLSNQPVTLNAQLFSANGSQLAAQPITMDPGQQISQSLQQIFSQSPDNGYVQLGLPPSGKAFFVSYPLIAGQASVETPQGGSAVIPLSATQAADSFILPAAIGAIGFEGIALLNTAASKVTVTLQALNLDGTAVSTGSLTLAPGQMIAQLTTQLLNGSLPSQAVIHVTSSAPIAVTAIGGSSAFDQIFALPVM